jgi:hypothetical protein
LFHKFNFLKLFVYVKIEGERGRGRGRFMDNPILTTKSFLDNYIFMFYDP